MARSPVALVEPTLLSWARVSAGLSKADLARSVKVEPERIEAWEAGEAPLSVAQLRKVAKVCHRPLAVFYLSSPPTDFLAVRDFRRVAEHSGEKDLSPELREALRMSFELREAAIDLVYEAHVEDDFSFPVRARDTDDPDDVASQLREAMDVAPHVQRSWQNNYAALRAWREAAESLGVMVTQMSGVTVEEARGFSVAEGPVPMVCINVNDSAAGRIFTLMHELTHLALRNAGLCEWEGPSRRSDANQRMETYCNRVAGAVLVPARDLLEDWDVSRGTGTRIWSEEEIRRLARKFSVSREVIVRRLVFVGRASEAFYGMKRQEYEEERKKHKPRPPGPVRHERRVANALGGTYIGLVLGAYYEHRITLAQTSGLLGVRVGHLPRLEREVMGWSHIRPASS